MTARRSMRPEQDWTTSDSMCPRELNSRRWTAWLDELGIEHSGIRDGDVPFPFATVVFRDPDNIQLELFAVC